MHYLIYKTTCLINGKTYVGKHQTKDINDGYIGSGKLLDRAVKKYGAENFVTIILHDFDEEWKMNVAESILVVPDKEVSYNLCPGGKGGFGYINSNPELVEKRDRVENKRKGRIAANRSILSRDDVKAKLAAHGKSTGVKNLTGTMLGKRHSDDTKTKMSASKVGAKNAAFGMVWVNDGINTIRVRKEALDEWTSKGYIRGRI